MALIVDQPADLSLHIGEEFGVSDWLLIDQDLIDRFADLSGDDQWIHVDATRAKSEMPGGKTIAHGLLTLCVMPRLAKGQLTIRHHRMAVNYGLNRLRFTAPVPVGSSVRLRSRVVGAEARIDGATMLTAERIIELEGGERPAMVAETVTLYYPTNEG